jgi:Xaa-Pro aminopeptidase
VAAVREVIARQQCTHALITDPADVEYISGFRSSNAMLLISRARLGLFTDFRYMESAKEFCHLTGDKWKLGPIEGSGFKSLKKLIRSGSAIGIQSNSLTMDRYYDLERTLPGAQFVPLPDELAGISIPKFEREIINMKTAAAIGDRALAALFPFVKESMTELELARALENLCAEYGSEKPAFDACVLFGERSALPHGRPTERRLAKSDFILIDFGCTVNGFRSDITRTFVYGRASEEQRNIHNIVLCAQERARLAARAGMTCKELDAVARSVIAERGYGEYFGHGTGHGVGLRVHENPRVSKASDAVLLENSVVTIEPGIYVPEIGGVRIEDMVLLQKDGAEVLTTTPRGLIELSV